MNTTKYYIVWLDGSEQPVLLTKLPKNSSVYLYTDDADEAMLLMKKQKPSWDDVVEHNKKNKSKWSSKFDKMNFSRYALTRRNHGHR